MLVWKHTERIEYVKNWTIFKENYKLYERILLQLRMRNIQSVIFM